MLNKKIILISVFTSSLLFGCNVYEKEQLEIEEQKIEIFDKLVNEHFDESYLKSVSELKNSDLSNIKERVSFLESINDNLLKLGFNENMRELDVNLMKEEFNKLQKNHKVETPIEVEIDGLLTEVETLVYESYKNNKTINLHEYLQKYNNSINKIKSYVNYNELLELYNNLSKEDLEIEISKKLYNMERAELLGKDSVEIILEIIINEFKVEKLDFYLELLDNYVKELKEIKINTKNKELEKQIESYNKKINLIYELSLKYNNPDTSREEKLKIRNELKNLN